MTADERTILEEIREDVKTLKGEFRSFGRRLAAVESLPQPPARASGYSATSSNAVEERQRRLIPRGIAGFEEV